MPANPRLAVPVDLAPRNALWCQAHARAAFNDPGATALASVDGLAVRIVDRALADGRVVVGIAGWRWTTDEPDAVGELAVSARDGGLALVGWWTPVGATALVCSRHGAALGMDVAGVTLWSGHRRVSTEDPARIRSLLGG